MTRWGLVLAFVHYDKDAPPRVIGTVVLTLDNLRLAAGKH